MSIIVYADFSCPDCYLASHRVDLLRAAGVDVYWRAVERLTGLPVAGRRLSEADREALAARFAELDALLLPGESLPRSIPAMQPRTEAAVTAYAEAEGAGVGDDVRRLLLDLYWRQGADIGSPSVLRTPLAGPILRGDSATEALRESGFAVSADRGPLTTAGWRRIRDWRAQWREFGSPALPVVLSDGATLGGRDALERLAKHLQQSRAELAPAFADARHYPSIAVRPDVHWVSWYGGRWRNQYRLPAA